MRVALLAALLAAAPAPAHASTASLDGGTLRFAGTPAGESVTFNADGSDVIVTGSGVAAGPGCRADRSGDVVCAGVARIDADLGDGDDTAELRDRPDPRKQPSRPTLPFRVAGGPGADSLAGGEGPDVLDGGPGEDTLNAFGGDDLLLMADGHNDSNAYCDAGRDAAVMDEYKQYVLTEEPDGCERVERHEGLAPGQAPTRPGRSTLFLLDAAGVPNDLAVTEAPGTLTLRDGSGLEPYPGCETLDAQTVRCANVVRIEADLGGGDDRLTWRGGTGTAHASLVGGPGDDTLLLGPGGDLVRGGEGDDTIGGGAGFDFIHGDEGADGLVGGAGADRLEGGDGPDRFDVRDGGAMAVKRGETVPRWTPWVEEEDDCTIEDTLLGDPLDLGRGCPAKIVRRDTDELLPRSAAVVVERVSPPDHHSGFLRVALACPRTVRPGCRGGVAVLGGTQRGRVKPFDLRPGQRRIVRPEPVGRSPRVVVQTSDGEGRTRSVTRSLRRRR